MAATFEETQDIIPRISFKTLLLTLVATLVFVAVCGAYRIVGIGYVIVLLIVFATVIAITYFVKIRITVEDGTLTVKMLRTYSVPLDHIIDVKKGDIDIMRNYSGWGIKKVKFRNYTAAGIDGAVSAKLLGRTVLTVTTARPDELYDILYENRRQD